MSAEQLHRIQRCRFEIGGARREDAPALQDEAFADWQPTLAAALERVFDRLAPSDRILRIDTLDIDASVETLRDPRQAVAHLERALRQRLAELGVFDQAPAQASAAKTDRARLGEWLRVFFETGHLPWWRAAPSRASFQRAFEDWIRSDPPAAEWLRSLASRHPSVALRVETQLSQRALARLLEALVRAPEARALFAWLSALALDEDLDATAPKFSPLALLWRQIAATASAAPLAPETVEAVALPELRRRLADAIRSNDAVYLNRFAARFIELPALVKRTLARQLFADLGRIEPMLASEPIGRFADPPAALRGILAARFAFVPLSLVQTAALWARAGPPEVPGDAAEMEAMDGERAAIRARSPNVSKRADSMDTPRGDDAGPDEAPFDSAPQDGALYIENAGLAILAPYFPAFFSNCGIRLALDPKERASAERAPALLQRLVFPHEPAMEYALPLNKILCGLPLQLPLPAEEAFDAAQADACDELLRAVVARWSRLGSTSLDAFRSTFLARAGSLEKTDFGWTLRVERGPFDVLLDTIPWTFKTVRFSWMPQPLLVEW